MDAAPGSFGRSGHDAHEPLLALFEAALAARSEPDQNTRDALDRCRSCANEVDAMVVAAGRVRLAASVVDFDLEPSPSLRDRVRAATVGAFDGRAADEAPRRTHVGLFGRFAWTGFGAAAGALVVAVALALGDVNPPAVAAFTMTGSELAPSAKGVVELRPLGGGSTAMTMQVSGIPASRPGEFYELWWVGPEKRHVSCGTFRSDGSPLTLQFTSGVDVSTTVLIEITLERDDGDPAPGPHVAQ